jgi:predicted RNase H-like HicB family nuclease
MQGKLYLLISDFNVNNEGVQDMKNEYTAVIKKQGNWWIGWIEEVPGVNCQERSYEELKKTLEVTLKEALEFNRQDAISAAGNEFTEENIAI